MQWTTFLLPLLHLGILGLSNDFALWCTSISIYMCIYRAMLCMLNLSDSPKRNILTRKEQTRLFTNKILTYFIIKHFWSLLIILLAGDIKRNPGPSSSDMSSLKNAFCSSPDLSLFEKKTVLLYIIMYKAYWQRLTNDK